MVNIYGYNLNTENDKLFESLDDRFSFWFQEYPQAFLLVGGDFNITLNVLFDRWPPKQSGSSSNALKTFMQKYNLVDVWREMHPNQNTYTWSNKNGTRQSRIDFWLVTSNTPKENILVNILVTPLTDHKAIFINIRFSSFVAPHCSSFWKMNISHLRHNSAKLELKIIISVHWDLAQKEGAFGRYWELLKYEVGKYINEYINIYEIRISEEKTVSEITSLSMVSPDRISPEERLRLTNLQYN